MYLMNRFPQEMKEYGSVTNICCKRKGRINKVIYDEVVASQLMVAKAIGLSLLHCFITLRISNVLEDLKSP